ncbi:MAG: head-tail connector protein [Bacteroidales bacterium]
MKTITLEELRAQVNVDYDDDDDYLSALIDVAEEAVESHINRPLEELLVEGKYPARIKHAVKLLCANLNQNRESIAYSSPHQVPYTYEYLLQPFKKYGV